MVEKLVLGAADYALFVLMLLVSSGIGLYFGIFGKKQDTNEDFLLAGKNMAILPVSISLMATFMSATTLMGIPAEMYLFGTNMTFMCIGFLTGVVISSFVFLPVYFKAGVSSSYEYLERRFGKSTKWILSSIFLLQMLLFNGVSLYAPALALSAVTSLSTWASVLSIGVVCTFYCTVGGMKAVIWTDVFQSILMYTCLLAIIVKGCLDLGGLENIFESAYDGGRILLPTFEMDFSRRYTMWSIAFLGIIITANGFGTNQLQVQRSLTLKTVRRAIIACLLSSPMLIIFQLMCCLCGLIFYVQFKSCDPMSSQTHPIQSADQLMPYYITSTMGQYPGLPGLCIAGIFSASLSTISSAVNSMAAVTYEDIIRSLRPNLSQSVLMTKICTLMYGVLTILVTFLAASLGKLVEATVQVVSLVSGPSLAIYLLAVFSPTTNEMGANIGVLAAFGVSGILTFMHHGRTYPTLPVGTNCSMPLEANNQTFLAVESTEGPMHENNFPFSYMWIITISFFICLIIGYFGSWILDIFRGPTKPCPDELLSPVALWFYRRNDSSGIQSDCSKKKVQDDCDTRF